MYPFPMSTHRKLRLITVDALERNPSGRRTIIRNDFTSSSVRATQGGAVVTHRGIDAAARPVTSKRPAKGRIKSSTVAIYTSIFALLVAVIAIGYRSPQETSATASAAPVANTQSTTQTAVNDVVATDIAASVADATDLAVAPNVAELAVSTRVQSEYSSSTDNSSISKPVIVQLSAASRKISSYAVQPGDTVASVAQKFGISEQTVRWANNLKDSDSLAAGSTVDILPVNGIVYTVKDGDTLDSIASKYGSSVSIITTYNDLELNGISTGLKIIIPDGQLPSTERPGYKAPVATFAAAGTFITGYSGGFGGGSTWRIGPGIGAAGGYAYGNCTAYAYWRRAQMGSPIGTNWGNAGAWATNARNAGFRVDRTPAAGAVIQDSGHVAIVEEVLPNGDLSLSEMNAYVSGGGFNIISGRILPASQVGQYYYIH